MLIFCSLLLMLVLIIKNVQAVFKCTFTFNLGKFTLGSTVLNFLCFFRQYFPLFRATRNHTNPLREVWYVMTSHDKTCGFVMKNTQISGNVTKIWMCHEISRCFLKHFCDDIWWSQNGDFWWHFACRYSWF